MSDLNQNAEASSLAPFLEEIQKYVFPLRETNFFSIEGIIGRYENPTSDLLRFFMSPNEAHGLGPLFVRAFFTCLNKEEGRLSLDNFTVQREVRTQDGKYIDFLISGNGWDLLIENKIYHWPANPFDSYEKYTQQYPSGNKLHLAILSPEGKSVEEWRNWQPVSYTQYCAALKKELTTAAVARSDSKWQIFAKELINHLEDTFGGSNMKMTPEQTAFVEANLPQIEALKKLSKAHTTELMSELAQRLEREVPGHTFHFFDADWAILCDHTAENLSMRFSFQTPAHPVTNQQKNYRTEAWVKGLTKAQVAKGTDLFANGSCQEQGGVWLGRHESDTRAEAVRELGHLARTLDNLAKNPALIDPG